MTDDFEERDRKIELNRGTVTPARSPKWLVVRCPAAETLHYVQELVVQDVAAWSPAQWVRKRLPRRKLKVWAHIPVIPSYLFILISDLPVFGRLPWSTRSELKPMKINGRFVVLDDKDLEALREIDESERPVTDMRPQSDMAPSNHIPTQPPKWQKGDEVKLLGVMSGMEGTVSEVNPGTGEVLVALKNTATKVRVSGFLLQPKAPYSDHGGPS